MNEDSPVIEIRRAERRDAEALGRLGALLVDVHHRLDPNRFFPATPKTPKAYADWLLQERDRETVLILVIERRGEVMGYCYADLEGPDYMTLRGPAGVIHDLVVDPSCRREGFGARLLDATMQALMDRGAPRIVLSTAERNAGAQALFDSRGLRRTMVEMTWDPTGGHADAPKAAA